MDPLFLIDGVDSMISSPNEMNDKRRKLIKKGYNVIGFHILESETGYLLFWRNKQRLLISKSHLEETIKALACFDYFLASAKPYGKTKFSIRIEKQEPFNWNDRRIVPKNQDAHSKFLILTNQKCG